MTDPSTPATSLVRVPRHESRVAKLAARGEVLQEEHKRQEHAHATNDHVGEAKERVLAA